MKYEIAIVSRTPAEVLSLEDAKRELDVTFDDDNALIRSQADQAVEWVENHTGRFLTPAVVDMIADELPPILRLPRGPVNAITSITVDGVAVSGFRAIGGSPYTVMPAAGSRWPYTATGLGAVAVRFTAGYAEGAVPPGIIAAIKCVLAIFYDKPTGAELNAQWNAVERMLSTYRLRSI